MPSPLALLLHPISLTLLASYATVIVWEAFAPARELPHVKNWRARGLVSFALYFLLSSYLPLVWSEHLARYQLFDLTGLGTWTGALVGLLVYEAGAYVWRVSEMLRFRDVSRPPAPITGALYSASVTDH